MDSRYRFLTLGTPWTQSMPSRDVNAVTRLAEASRWRDNKTRGVMLNKCGLLTQVHLAKITCIKIVYVFIQFHWMKFDDIIHGRRGLTNPTARSHGQVLLLVGLVLLLCMNLLRTSENQGQASHLNIFLPAPVGRNILQFFFITMYMEKQRGVL